LKNKKKKIKMSEEAFIASSFLLLLSFLRPFFVVTFFVTDKKSYLL
jgi:hypothetical protein